MNYFIYLFICSISLYSFIFILLSYITSRPQFPLPPLPSIFSPSSLSFRPNHLILLCKEKISEGHQPNSVRSHNKTRYIPSFQGSMSQPSRRKRVPQQAKESETVQTPTVWNPKRILSSSIMMYKQRTQGRALPNKVPDLFESPRVPVD